jgi:hypothetical protein
MTHGAWYCNIILSPRSVLKLCTVRNHAWCNMQHHLFSPICMQRRWGHEIANDIAICMEGCSHCTPLQTKYCNLSLPAPHYKQNIVTCLCLHPITNKIIIETRLCLSTLLEDTLLCIHCHMFRNCVLKCYSYHICMLSVLIFRSCVFEKL